MNRLGTVLMLSSMLLPAVAAAQTRVQRVAAAMPRSYVEATCDIDAGNFLVSSSATYLKSAGKASDPVKSIGLNEKGVEVAVRAILENDQAENGAAWYYLGRNALQLGDIVGADSAFTHASALLPACGEDILTWRRRAWSSLAIPATEFSQQGKDDSALVLFRQSTMIAGNIPIGYYNVGVMFTNSGQLDSAEAYFAKAQEVAARDLTQFTKDRNDATFNLAAIYMRQGKHELAVAEFQKFVGWVPADIEAKRALAAALRGAGRPEEAVKVENELVASAEASGTLSGGDAMNMGVNLFNAGKYQEAAVAFEKVLAIEPNNYDALFNLANSWFALKDAPKLTITARSLVARAPLSEENRRLLAQSFNMQQMQDSLLAQISSMMALPTSATITSFAVTPTGAELVGAAVGKKAERDGAELPAAETTLVVEFLATDGTVVDSQEVTIPALLEAQTYEWKATGSGKGITAWRYHVK